MDIHEQLMNSLQSQQGQLRFLLEATGMEWEVVGPQYIQRCVENGIKGTMFIAMPLGFDKPFLAYYKPVGFYCTTSMQIVHALKKIKEKLPSIYSVLPAIKYDAKHLPEVVLTRIEKNRVLTATFGFDGDLILSHVSSKMPLTVGNSVYALSLNASYAIGQFLQTMKLDVEMDHYKTSRIGLGYSVSNKAYSIWNTSLTVFPNLDFVAAANPQPVFFTMQEWIVEGQLGFHVSGKWIDLPQDPTAEVAEIEKVSNSSLQTWLFYGGIALGGAAVLILGGGVFAAGGMLALRMSLLGAGAVMMGTTS